MVVFTCNNCGESLQKPKVEKHYAFACRKSKSLTCVDCFKDFRGEEYVVHTKCITEDERYAAKGTYVNGIVKKGEVKQESWMEMIKSILENETNIKPSNRALLNTFSNYSNVPRKKNKFMNFIKNSSGGRVNMKDVVDVWNIIEHYKNSQSKTNLNEHGQTKTKEKLECEENDNVIKEKNLKNDRKRKTNIEETEETITRKKKKHKNNEEIKEKEETKTFQMKDIILDILKTRGSISIKKLQKKVINRYLTSTGETEISPKVIKKFNKKIDKLKELEVNDGLVILKSVDE